MVSSKRIGLAAMVVAVAAGVYDAKRIVYDGIDWRALYTQNNRSIETTDDVCAVGLIGSASLITAGVSFYLSWRNRGRNNVSRRDMQGSVEDHIECFGGINRRKEVLGSR